MTSALFLKLVACASAASAATAAASSSVKSPQRITFASLTSANGDSNLLLDVLTKDGYVSITDISAKHGLQFREMKHNLMSNLDECFVDIGDDVPSQRLEDGTVRRSFATATLPSAQGSQQQEQSIQLLDDFLARNPNKSAACRAFQDGLSDFRSTVGDATSLFAARLSVELGVALPSPLLSSSNDNRGDDYYNNVESVVMGGEQLEHFHSYRTNNDAGEDKTTIELHTDQGLFIAFTPGMLVDAHSDKQLLDLSSGFYVQDPTTGESVLLDFSEDDDLVFMLGDGVNQIINHQLGDQDGKKVLRATPHALSLSNEQPRVWYGRMVLPPSDAFVPSTETTFGQLRQGFVESSSKGESIPPGIGCSSKSKMVINTSRFLAGEEGKDDGEHDGGHGIAANQCADDEMFCWFRCMALTDETMTCGERSLGLQCVDPRGMVVEGGAGHGDYFPACTNHTHLTNPITPYPKIDQQDVDVCTNDLWDEFNAQEGYSHVISLKPDPSKPGPDTNLFWSIIENEDGTKKLKARLTFNDVFGWLSIGFANVFDTVHNGMNGGKILLMKPGGNYSPVTGLDLSVGANIGAYVIDDKDSAFRHWVDTESVAEGADHEHTDCFTALTFESDSIGGQAFNFTGTDEMIWAGNSNDYYVGYHSRNSRARMTINWVTGEVDFFTSTPAWATADDEHDSATEEEVDVESLGPKSKMEEEGSSATTVGASLLGYVVAILSFAML